MHTCMNNPTSVASECMLYTFSVLMATYILCIFPYGLFNLFARPNYNSIGVHLYVVSTIFTSKEVLLSG